MSPGRNCPGQSNLPVHTAGRTSISSGGGGGRRLEVRLIPGGRCPSCPHYTRAGRRGTGTNIGGDKKRDRSNDYGVFSYPMSSGFETFITGSTAVQKLSATIFQAHVNK